MCARPFVWVLRPLAPLLCAAVALGLQPRVEAEDESPFDVARVAIRCADTGDEPGFAAIAQGSVHDVWEIVDELLGLQRLDVAQALASAIDVPEDRTALLRQLARERPGEAEGRRSALREADCIPTCHRGDAGVLLAPLLPPARPEGDLTTILDARGAYAMVHVACDRFQEPEAILEAFRVALRAARRVGWGSLELRVANELAVWAQERARLCDVRADLDAVLPLARGRERSRDVAQLLTAYGVLLAEAGDSAGAANYLRDAARVYAVLHDPTEEARALSYLGQVLLGSGDLSEALDLQLRARALEDERGFDDDELADDIEVATASVYECLGMLAKSQALLEGVLARYAARPAGDRVGLAVARGNLARTRFLAGDPQRACRDLRSCERLFEEAGHHDQALDALALQGWCEAASEVSAATVRRLEGALAEDGPSLDPLRRSVLAEALARCHLAVGRAPDAVRVLAPTIDALTALDLHLTQVVDLPGEYGAALVAAGRAEEALPWIDRYVDGLLANVDGLDVASTRTFRGIVAGEALAAGVRAAHGSGDLDRLWRYMESVRAIRLLASLGGRSRVEELVIPKDLRRQLQGAAHALLVARQELARAASGRTTSAAELQERRMARDGAERYRNALGERVKEARQQAELSELKRGARLLSLSSLRRALLPGEAVVSLSGLLAADQVLALVVAREAAPRAVVFPGLASLGEAAAALRGWQGAPLGAVDASTTLAAPEPTLAQRLETLRALLRPLALTEGFRRVYVVPDAALAYVPFAALWPDRDVALLPCGSLLEHLRPYISRRSGSRALALAMSEYDATAPVEGSDGLLALLASPRVRGSPMRLRRLPLAAEEGRGVAGQDGVLLLNGAVTSARLLELLALPEAPVWSTIHFACHGLVNSECPSLSGLALADGVLTAQEIFPLRLKTDMVVLSACDTATDPYVMGEGITGLVRAFLQAGSPRVLASLWAVPDAPTAALMTSFYELLRADPELSPATALRRAQAQVARTWPSPENWAAWTLWGAP